MTHYWPSDDAFTSGTTVYGDWPSAYMRAGFWTSKTIAHPVSGSYTSTINASELHDAFTTVAGFDAREVTPETDPGGFVWRALESSADGVVTMGFGYRALAGGPLSEQVLSTCFVAARMTGATYTSATNSHTAWQDGYLFGFLNSGALFATWYLLRINSGTITVLQSAVFRNAARVTDEFPASLGEIELDIEDDAGDVHLVGRIRRIFDGAQEEEDIFDYTDTSGSKITAAGRYGWALNGRRAVGGGIVAPMCTFFQVTEGGTTRVRDEWQRALRQAGLSVTETVGITTYTGRTMLCAWAGDFHGVAPFDQKLWRSKVGGLGNRINIDPSAEPIGSGSGQGGFCYSMRRPTDRRSQNRSLQFRFSSLQQDGTAGTTNPTAGRSVGIVLRASQTLAPSNSTIPVLAYHALIQRDDGAGTATCFVYRWRSGASTLLASVAVTANVDTDYTLRFDAYNLLDTAGDNIAACVLRVFIGGVQVVLDQVDPNVEVTAAGTIIDGTSQRIVEGALDGIYLWCPDGDKTTFVTAWAESTLTNATGVVPAAQASIAVPAEADNDSGQTFTVPYDWGVEEIPGRDAHETAFESGHKRACNAYTAGRRRWRVSAAAITAAQRAALLTFWDDHNGTEVAFSFVPPYATAAVKAHFYDETLGHQLEDVGVHSYRIEIEELFA